MRAKTNMTRIFGALLVASLSAFSALAAPLVYATGVTAYDPARAYPVYTLFAAPDGVTHMIDMDGNEVHRWSAMGFPSKLLDPKMAGGKKGQLLVQLEQMEGTHAAGQYDFNNIFHDKSIGEVDWAGNVTWSYGAQVAGGLHQNHDLERLANGDTLVLESFDRHIDGFKAEKTADQAIEEVTPAGKVIWRWVVGDHVAEFGFSEAGMAMLRNGFSIDSSGDAGRTGFLTINDMTTLGPNRWFDAGDARFDPANIMINSREANFIAIIDRKSGKIVWRLGPDFPGSEKSPDGRVSNGKLPRPVDQMSGEHFAHLIPKGLPGAGNLLVLDNQGNAGIPPAYVESIDGSRVLEIDPSTKQVVWQYNGELSDAPLWSFHTEFMGSVQRLPNGNTLVDEAQFGHVFQITPKGEIVWDYVSSYFGHGKVGGSKEVWSNYLYRVQPVPYDWAPAGTPHAEKPINKPDLATFRVQGAP